MHNYDNTITNMINKLLIIIDQLIYGIHYIKINNS